MDDVEDADLCLAGNASEEETVQFKDALARQLNVLMEADDADATLVEYICVMVLSNRKKMNDVGSAIEDLLGASVAMPLYEWLCEYVRDLCETHEVLRQEEAMLEQQQLERRRQQEQRHEEEQYAEMFQEEEEECGEGNGMEQEKEEEEEEEPPQRRIGSSSVVSQHDTRGLHGHQQKQQQQQQQHRHSRRSSSSSSSSFSSSPSSRGGDRLFSSALQQSVRSVCVPVTTPGANGTAAVPPEAEREERRGRIVWGSFAEANSARGGGGVGGGGGGGGGGATIGFGGKTNGLGTFAGEIGGRVVEVVRMPQLQQEQQQQQYRRTVTPRQQCGRSQSRSREREQLHHHHHHHQRQRQQQQQRQHQQQQQRGRSEERNVHFMKSVRNGITSSLPPSLTPSFNCSFSRNGRRNEKPTVFRITGIGQGGQEGGRGGREGMFKAELATAEPAVADAGARDGKEGGECQISGPTGTEAIYSSPSHFLSSSTPSPSSGDKGGGEGGGGGGAAAAAGGTATLSSSAPPFYPRDSLRGSGGYGPIREGRGRGRGSYFRHHTPYAHYPPHPSFPLASSRAGPWGKGGGKNMSLVLTPPSSGATKAGVLDSAPPTTAPQATRGAVTPSPPPLTSTTSSSSSSPISASSIPPQVTHNRSLVRNPVTGRMTHHKVWVRPTAVAEAAGTAGAGGARRATTGTDGTTKYKEHR